MTEGSVKKVRISGALLVNVLSQGTGACHAVVGIPINSILVGCRMAEAQVLELDFFSHEWDDQSSAVCIALFAGSDGKTLLNGRRNILGIRR